MSQGDPMHESSESTGRQVLHAVERILDSTDDIIALVERLKRQSDLADRPEEMRDLVGRRLVAIYSNRSALSGGATALPALVPGWGTLATLAGGTLVDMGLMLKFEVEMTLALSWLYGFDIHQERERQVAFLLASVGTYDARTGRNFFVDLAEAEGTAIWNYAPREVTKFLVSVLTKVALLYAGRSFVKAIPLVGVVVGTGANKVLTRKVGQRCIEDLRRRRRLADEVEAGLDDVVEAQVRSPEPAEGA